MATSGTYAFSPEAAEFCEEAFERCGIDPAALTARHVRSARRSLDFMFSEWSNKGPHLWAVDQQSQILTASDASYTVPTGTIAILEMVIRRDGVDIPVFPMARDEYLAIPDKTAEGLPNRFFFDRVATAPMIYLWNTPENSTDTLYYYRMRALQDVGAASNTLDIPPRWNEAVASGLAAKLAVKYAPDRIGPLTGVANARFKEATTEDRERTPTNTRVKYTTNIRRR
jgi:hypothetical protein